MNKKRIDLIFCSVNKHKVNMSFDVFLQALIKIAEFKYHHRSSESLQQLISEYMVPLHQEIHSVTKSKRIVGGILDIKYDELVALIYRDVGAILLEVYKVYFPNEVKGERGGMLEETMWRSNEK